MSAARIVRVVTEVAAVDKAFDYLVPEGLTIGVGDRVRVDLHGRSVRGWVIAVNVPDEGRDLKPLKKWAGFGPPASLFPLAEWAAQHYVTPLSRALAAASAERNITALPTVPTKPPIESATDYAAGVWELAPTTDPLEVILSAYATTRDDEGSLLVMVPTEGWAERLSARLVARGLQLHTSTRTGRLFGQDGRLWLRPAMAVSPRRRPSAERSSVTLTMKRSCPNHHPRGKQRASWPSGAASTPSQSGSALHFPHRALGLS